MKNKFLTDEPVIQTETVDDEKVSPVVDEINTSEKSEAIERVIDSPEVITPKKDEAII